MAMIASMHAMECTRERDECRNTAEFKYAGQNIFVTVGNLSYTNFIKFSIDGWWYEHYEADAADINAFGSSPNISIGEFANMAQDHTHVIGCAASVYTQEDNSQVFFLVCNYSFRALIRVPIYKTGDPTSGCKTGKNPHYKNLCSRDEVVDMNDHLINNDSNP